MTVKALVMDICGISHGYSASFEHPRLLVFGQHLTWAALSCLRKVESGTLPSPAVLHSACNWNVDMCLGFHQFHAGDFNMKVSNVMGAEGGTSCSSGFEQPGGHNGTIWEEEGAGGTEGGT